MGPQMTPALGGIFLILWLGMVLGMIAGWILVVIAIWRGMKAHESIAESIRQIARKQQ